jgi:hypothetical protein
MDKTSVSLLTKAVDVHGLGKVADDMGKSPRTIRRWMAGICRQ